MVEYTLSIDHAYTGSTVCR